MARTGGRSVWIAVPATLLCFAVVGALVWLAVPMVPVVITWAGDTLRGATERAQRETEVQPAVQAIDDGAIDCRSLYPDGLWSELLWTPGILLTQNAAPPATVEAALVDALAPEVIVTCAWVRTEPGSVITTLARVDADARPIAEAALRADGFACAADGEALRCGRERGRAAEEHVFRDDLWLANVGTAWMPEDYTARLEKTLWG
ncbi:hypothetical protein [Microbacterium hominis]|uniref:Uncharacterized protein n=1 Tax=Microbacterium hominis TaxID=162426 RepID=A0A7D4TDX0_9MICO|nr:hypothetical protein [Microbacterium hominis]QKJ18460.1 hypothetical protein HQM25_02985 [Microbacterium hominis]